jgi:hypothetical protein
MNLALLRVGTANKPSLISKSGMETQVNIHHAGENLTTLHMYDLEDPLCAIVCDDDQGVGPDPTSP